MINPYKPTTVEPIEIDGIGRIQRISRRVGNVICVMYSKGWNLEAGTEGVTGWTDDIEEADRFTYAQAKQLIKAAQHRATTPSKKQECLV